MAQRVVQVKKVVVEWPIISRRLFIPGMPSSSKGTTISDEPSDPQSPSPTSNNAAGVLLNFATPAFDTSFASRFASRGDKTAPKDLITNTGLGNLDRLPREWRIGIWKLLVPNAD